MVYTAEAMLLVPDPVAVAIAWRVVVAEMEMGPVYAWEAVVGVVPSVV
jgi:hypothetical protein